MEPRSPLRLELLRARPDGRSWDGALGTAQTRETLANIEALIEEDNRVAAGAFALDALTYKVYVRHPNDLPAVRTEIDAAVGAAASRVYFKAEICRRDLSVEIEAVGQRT